MLGRFQVARGVDGGVGLLEDPIVDRTRRAVRGHELLEREGQSAAAGGGVPGHDRQESLRLGFGQERVELGDRLGRLGHPDLGRQFLVVEHAGQAVVESHRVQRARTTGAVRRDPVLGQLGRGPLVPSEGGGVLVHVLQQPVMDQRHHARQPDEVRRVVAGQQAGRGVHQVGELVLFDVPGHVRELLGELVCQIEGKVESCLEIRVEYDIVLSAGGEGDGFRGRRR